MVYFKSNDSGDLNGFVYLSGQSHKHRKLCNDVEHSSERRRRRPAEVMRNFMGRTFCVSFTDVFIFTTVNKIEAGYEVCNQS